MARFAQQYIVPALRGVVEVDKVMLHCVEEALYAYSDALSAKLAISPHVLHKEIKTFLEEYKEIDPVEVTQCRGRTEKNTRCMHRPMWHGFCKKHECQYYDKVKEHDRLVRRRANAIVHVGHGPTDGFVDGCPGCEKKKRASYASYK